MQVWVQSLFLFAVVWSLGANTDDEGRGTFDHMLRKLLINDPPAELKPHVKVRRFLVHVQCNAVQCNCQSMSCKLAQHDCLQKQDSKDFSLVKSTNLFFWSCFHHVMFPVFSWLQC